MASQFMLVPEQHRVAGLLLSIFPSRFTKEAADKVLGVGIKAADVLKELEQLRLLDWVDSCYQMPNLMREEAKA